MDIYETRNYCSNIDDYRPIQSTLLTRFTTKDCSESWRTTNQDYGAFYYRHKPEYCIPDNLKSKIHRRYDRFQDWFSYQIKCQNDNNSNNQSIFPSNRNETVRITHRKTFLSNSNEKQNTFSPCGESGLITEYIVKKILKKLQNLINSDEYSDVLECAQILVTDILTQEPSLCINEIIDRVINIMITPPDNIEQLFSKPCPSPQELPLNTTVMNCNETVFEKLTNLENAISKLSKSFC